MVAADGAREANVVVVMACWTAGEWGLGMCKGRIYWRV